MNTRKSSRCFDISLLVQVTLQFLSEHLRLLPLSMVQLLSRYIELEQYEQHAVVYSRDEEALYYYVVLSGLSLSMRSRSTTLWREVQYLSMPPCRPFYAPPRM
jgi:hypothetical protein